MVRKHTYKKLMELVAPPSISNSFQKHRAQNLWRSILTLSDQELVILDFYFLLKIVVVPIRLERVWLRTKIICFMLELKFRVTLDQHFLIFLYCYYHYLNNPLTYYYLLVPPPLHLTPLSIITNIYIYRYRYNLMVIF